MYAYIRGNIMMDTTTLVLTTSANLAIYYSAGPTGSSPDTELDPELMVLTETFELKVT